MNILIAEKEKTMANDKIFSMPFSKIYPLLINKVVRKGRSKQEVDEVINWLTGYSIEEIERIAQSEITYGSFFENAPEMNIVRFKIKGSICKVGIEEISDPLMRDIRILDKLVDGLAKGKDLSKMLPGH